MVTSAATVTPPVFLSGLARRLVADRLLTEAQAKDLQQKAQRQGQSLVMVMIEGKSIPARKIAEAASDEFGVPLFDLNAWSPDPEVVGLVNDKLLRQSQALPLMLRGRTLYVAICDPTQLAALEEIKFATGFRVEPIIAEGDKLARLVETTASSMEGSSLNLGDDDLVGLEVADTEPHGADVTKSDADDAPIVKFVNRLMVDAINQGCSDIHIEPYEKSFRIRYRKDGELKVISSPPRNIAVRIAARVKVMARLDLAERRIPQDGRIKLQLSRSKSIDFRVSTCPTLWGEKIVARILDPAQAQMGIDALGYEDNQKQAYLQALEKPQGMILVTGPTGSGKTVSLYTGLTILNTENINISTAEDPAEINLPGVNQVNVNPRIGLTFAAALRAFLRQDPDVIMVGEIRDLETAEIAIKAAQTGHLVLSTLHTNDAPQSIVRLMNMGVPAYNLSSTLTLIIAQRLARKLCPQCKKTTDIPRPELLKEGFTAKEVDDPGFQIYRAVGRDDCDRGYRGRTGVYEVMPFSEAMGRIIMEGGSVLDISEQAEREGVKNLRQSALLKVKSGVLDLTEANRITITD